MRIYYYQQEVKNKAKKAASSFPKKNKERAQLILETLIEKARELAFVGAYELFDDHRNYYFNQSSFRYLFDKYSEQILSYANTSLKTDRALGSLQLLEKYADLIGVGLFGLEGKSLPISSNGLEERLTQMIEDSRSEIFERQTHATRVGSYLHKKEAVLQPRNPYVSRPNHPSEDS